jgi:hypothetical protein
MYRSKLPLTVWFWAAHLMATHSNGMSAVQFEAQLGITYKTAWLLAQKLRRSMIDPQREPLEGVVEVDQAEIPFRADNSFFDPVYGRRTYEIMRYGDENLPEWDAEELDFAAAWRSQPKWVVSRSLKSVGPQRHAGPE